MKSKRWLGSAFLLIAAFLWGSTFVAQSETGVGPFTYLAMRSLVAVVFLTPIVLLSDFREKRKNPQSNEKKTDKRLLLGGLICGCALFFASSLQQIGIDKGTTAGNAGFITALYILIVPILGLFFRQKVRPLHWVCIFIALVGLFLLCMTGDIEVFSIEELFSANTYKDLSVKPSDIYVLASAFVFSIHILVVDKLSPKVDCLRLSLIQFAVVAVISSVVMFVAEAPKIGDILDSWVSILYAGVLSSGVAYTLQIFGQRYTPPTIASILMSLESTFAVISAIVFSAVATGVPELPTGYEWMGCGLMFAAIMLSQLPQKNVSSESI